jgi:2-polyprenyl-3-methyl-5-hydroxy-6-metoxy-1,4-benzoquinol methylase
MARRSHLPRSAAGQCQARERYERLLSLTISPYRPEPPRRSRLVDAVMKLGAGSQRRTPHLHGGADLDKALYEYRNADDWWSVFGGAASLATMAGKEVLDVGCGWGGKAVSYAERSGLRSITGFDLAEAFDPTVAEKFAASHSVADRCRFTTGVAEDIPFPPESFDVALLDDVLEHVADPVKVIGECARVLRPGGLLLVKFPSVRMFAAHHLDRALVWPGLQYLAGFRTWAAGLNDYLLRHPSAGYEPFDEVVSTPFHPAVTRNLNGLDFRSFRRIVEASPLQVVRLEIVPTNIRPLSPLRRAVRRAYRLACIVPPIRERLGVTISLVGLRPPDGPGLRAPEHELQRNSGVAEART